MEGWVIKPLLKTDVEEVIEIVYRMAVDLYKVAKVEAVDVQSTGLRELMVPMGCGVAASLVSVGKEPDGLALGILEAVYRNAVARAGNADKGEIVQFHQ